MISAGKISVIIPVLHEGNIINDVIDRIRSQVRSNGIQIIVVDGSTTKDTIRSISRKAVLKISSPKGRSFQMNKGADQAKGEILLFLHADTSLPENGFELIREALNNKQISAGAFDLGFDKVNPIIRSFTFINNYRARITRTPYGDQAIFMRREVFQDLQGFKEIDLFEDVDLMRRSKKNGYRIRILKERVTTSGRRFNEDGAFRRLFRNIILIFLYNVGADPNKLARYY